MALGKLNQVIGFLGDIEATYGTAETLSNSTDGFNVYIGDGDPQPPEAYEYVYDGKIGRAFGTLAPQIRTTPNGRYRQGQVRVLPKGLGSAYSSSSVVPPNEIHRWLQACGLTATFSTDHWVYTPTAHGNGYKSLTLEAYLQGSLYPMTGVLGNLSFETQGLGVPVWTIDYKGLAGTAPTDAALPSITVLAPSVIAPVSSSVTVSIGSFTDAVVRRIAFRSNRNIDTARIDMLTATGHAGFVPGGMAPELEIEIETPARSTYDPDAVRDAATVAAISVGWDDGGTANNWTVDFAQAQLANVQRGNDGALATTTLTYTAHSSTPAANDFMTITFGA